VGRLWLCRPCGVVCACVGVVCSACGGCRQHRVARGNERKPRRTGQRKVVMAGMAVRPGEMQQRHKVSSQAGMAAMAVKAVAGVAEHAR